MTYEIPMDGYDGRVSLQTLARRVSRACVHYLQVTFRPLLENETILTTLTSAGKCHPHRMGSGTTSPLGGSLLRRLATHVVCTLALDRYLA